ncbi:aldehyde dehydrogenase family protein, partial [Acinetobacter baumannii]|uniref:aldehyde dehydrogenase family protein n=1 Tax=Acinetobacter baumannii TaxID=470 RepID=UPI000AA56CEE
CAGSRLYVHKKVYDNVLSDMVSHAQKIKIGNGLLPDTEMGPLVSAEQHSRVTDYIDIGCKEGAQMIAAVQEEEA